MTGLEIAELYERDIQKLINEINSFRNDDNLWKTAGTIKNSGGNLALHIIGGLNFLIGTRLAGTGYIRNRDYEFEAKGIDRNVIVENLQALIRLIKNTIAPMLNDQLNAPYPEFFDKEDATVGYVLTQLLLHLNYHAGQVNYLRRILE